MQALETTLKRALTSGTVAGAVTMLAAGLAGRRETGSYAAPLNATSHVIWGDQAAMRNSASLKYTLTGFVINHAAAVFWAAVYERLFGHGAKPKQVARDSRDVLRPVMGSALVTTGAYLIDYYLVPKRLTPGFEKRLSDKSLIAVFCAMALGLAAGSWIAERQ